MVNENELEKGSGDIQHFEFYVASRQITAIFDGGKWYLPFQQVCLLLGLNPQEQLDLFELYPALKTGDQGDQIKIASEFGRVRLDILAYWLTILSPHHISDPALRDAIASFQAEAVFALQEAFMTGRLTDWPTLSAILERDTPLTRIYREALNVISAVRQQLLQRASSQNFDS